MVRSIFKHINFPIAYFPSNGFDIYPLYPCVWEVVRILESVGFKVRGLVSDGATLNRKFYRMHLHFDKHNQKDGITYSTWNQYAPNRKPYFFSDPPHLVKTLQNNWENSHGHLNTRNLVVSNEIVMSSSDKFIFTEHQQKCRLLVFAPLNSIFPRKQRSKQKTIDVFYLLDGKDLAVSFFMLFVVTEKIT